MNQNYLAPIAVKPNFQKQGIGSKLIEEGIRRCEALGYGIVLLIGTQAIIQNWGFNQLESMD
jgi:putative acetyltransferase